MVGALKCKRVSAQMQIRIFYPLPNLMNSDSLLWHRPLLKYIRIWLILRFQNWKKSDSDSQLRLQFSNTFVSYTDSESEKMTTPSDSEPWTYSTPTRTPKMKIFFYFSSRVRLRILNTFDSHSNFDPWTYSSQNEIPTRKMGKNDSFEFRFPTPTSHLF